MGIVLWGHSCLRALLKGEHGILPTVRKALREGRCCSPRPRSYSCQIRCRQKAHYLNFKACLAPDWLHWVSTLAGVRRNWVSPPSEGGLVQSASCPMLLRAELMLYPWIPRCTTQGFFWKLPSLKVSFIEIENIPTCLFLSPKQNLFIVKKKKLEYKICTRRGKKGKKNPHPLTSGNYY